MRITEEETSAEGRARNFKIECTWLWNLIYLGFPSRYLGFNSAGLEVFNMLFVSTKRDTGLNYGYLSFRV